MLAFVYNPYPSLNPPRGDEAQVKRGPQALLIPLTEQSSVTHPLLIPVGDKQRVGRGISKELCSDKSIALSPYFYLNVVKGT